MAINYIPNDEVFSSWQPHLDEQSIDDFLKACEFGESFPDVFDLPPYQALEENFPIDDPDTSVYAGDNKRMETRISEAHTGEEIDINKMFSIDECLSAGNETGISKAHPEAEFFNMLNMDPLNKEYLTERNEDPLLTLSWDGIPEFGTPSSGTAHCCCCDEVADMKRQVRNILIGAS